jgi:hypothetical protein
MGVQRGTERFDPHYSPILVWTNIRCCELSNFFQLPHRSHPTCRNGTREIPAARIVLRLKTRDAEFRATSHALFRALHRRREEHCGLSDGFARARCNAYA